MKVLKLDRFNFARVLGVIVLVLMSSYCTRPENQTKIAELTADEAYLIHAYVEVAKARDLRSVSYFRAESLFTFLDSTIDTTRIANTIAELNRDPDRWLLIFSSIERDLKSSQGQELEETR